MRQDQDVDQDAQDNPDREAWPGQPLAAGTWTPTRQPVPDPVLLLSNSTSHTPLAYWRRATCGIPYYPGKDTHAQYLHRWDEPLGESAERSPHWSIGALHSPWLGFPFHHSQPQFHQVSRGIAAAPVAA